MPTVWLISHPEVRVDPAVPVPSWSLSEKGRARMMAFCARADLPRFAAIFASEETKAREAAAILAARFGRPVECDAELGENDRSATGFVPPDEFERLADAFFGEPERSVRGWERAVDAQARIVRAVDRVLAGAVPGNVAIVAHGGVGTLLLCHYLGVPIARAHDQPHQGHVLSFDRETRRVIHPWVALEAFAPITA